MLPGLDDPHAEERCLVCFQNRCCSKGTCYTWGSCQGRPIFGVDEGPPELSRIGVDQIRILAK